MPLCQGGNLLEDLQTNESERSLNQLRQRHLLSDILPSGVLLLHYFYFLTPPFILIVTQTTWQSESKDSFYHFQHNERDCLITPQPLLFVKKNYQWKKAIVLPCWPFKGTFHISRNPRINQAYKPAINKYRTKVSWWKLQSINAWFYYSNLLAWLPFNDWSRINNVCHHKMSTVWC